MQLLGVHGVQAVLVKGLSLERQRPPSSHRSCVSLVCWLWGLQSERSMAGCVWWCINRSVFWRYHSKSFTCLLAWALALSLPKDNSFVLPTGLEEPKQGCTGEPWKYRCVIAGLPHSYFILFLVRQVSEMIQQYSFSSFAPWWRCWKTEKAG